MAAQPEDETVQPLPVDVRWADLYRIGAVSCLVVAALVVCAIVAFFIWPYEVGSASTEEIFAALRRDRFGALMSLDLLFVVIMLINVLPLLALYAALRQVNESYALIALVFGLMAVVLLISIRPLSELALLSERHADAATEAARGQYVAAGEALLAVFDGTAWMIQTVLLLLSGLISSLLMLRSQVFTRATAYVGIGASVVGLGFFVPVIGVPLLFVNTIGGIIWYVLVARGLFRLGRMVPRPG